MSFDYKPHIMKLKGKEYLPVAARIAWLRSEHPGAHIEAELVTLDLEAQLAVFRATVVIPETGARAVDYGSETAKDFEAYIEKASTKAIGRAIAALGYGTLMALELDEGERVVDSPQASAARNGGGAGATAPPVGAQAGAKPAATAQRGAASTVTAPVPQPAADPHAALRAEVVSLLASDAEAAGKLPKGADTMTGQELEKTRVWVMNRAEEARAVAAAQQPEPEPADEHAPLRTEVVALLAEDGPALALLQQQGKPLPPEQDAATLAKTKTWLLQRQQQQRPRSARLTESIARAGSPEDVMRAIADARRSQEKKEITAAEYTALYQAAEARKAELSAPLLAGSQGRAQVAS